jgi:hypothetical protein
MLNEFHNTPGEILLVAAMCGVQQELPVATAAGVCTVSHHETLLLENIAATEYKLSLYVATSRQVATIASRYFSIRFVDSGATILTLPLWKQYDGSAACNCRNAREKCVASVKPEAAVSCAKLSQLT